MQCAIYSNDSVVPGALRSEQSGILSPVRVVFFCAFNDTQVGSGFVDGEGVCCSEIPGDENAVLKVLAVQASMCDVSAEARNCFLLKLIAGCWGFVEEHLHHAVY